MWHKKGEQRMIETRKQKTQIQCHSSAVTVTVTVTGYLFMGSYPRMTRRRARALIKDCLQRNGHAVTVTVAVTGYLFYTLQGLSHRLEPGRLSAC